MNPWQKPVKVTTFSFKGDLYPFQHQGALFLAGVKNCLFTDSVGLGKTVQAIVAIDILRNKTSDLQVIVVTMASVQIQFEREIHKFLPAIKAKAVLGDQKTRTRIYEDFANKKIDIIILNYSQPVRDTAKTLVDGIVYDGPLTNGVKNSKYIMILDEVQKCKNVSSKTSKSILGLKQRSLGVKAMTATPVYTHLIDLYGIFKLIDPNIFKTKEQFKKEFCKVQFPPFCPYGRIVGYKNHDILKERIKNFVFGRTKSEVAKDLPPLVTKDVFVTLPKEHRKVYDKLDQQIDLLDENLKKEKIASMVQMQVCVNALESTKDYSGGLVSHPKLDEVARLVEEDLVDEKVVIYSRYLDTLALLTKKIKDFSDIFRITGVESQLQRDKNLSLWRESKRTACMLITDAGGAGLNLQIASTLILIDRPWSGGQLDQLRGRIHRIGSAHKSLLEINVVAENTIDEYVLKSLRDKRTNSTLVFGDTDSPIPLDAILEMRSAQKTKR